MAISFEMSRAELVTNCAHLAVYVFEFKIKMLMNAIRGTFIIKKLSCFFVDVSKKGGKNFEMQIPS